ncbi:hypothetical protein [Pseudomonas silesiensis]|jgi:hypothetical protein|nr:hypothetical protein [Pseudomonas silesiensis]
MSDLPETIRQQAEKALPEIESAGSRVFAIKSGAQAYLRAGIGQWGYHG